MIRDYPGRVRRREVLVGAVVLAAAIAGLVAVATWLRVEGHATAPAPASSASGTPGAVTCPDDAVAGEVVSSGTLIDCPGLFDGRTVRYTGEVIEAVFDRGGRPVVVLNDDAYALGDGPVPQTRTPMGANSGITVVLPAGFAAQIHHVGSYSARGDVVEVIGTFDAASRLLGGEPAIDGHSATLAQPGRPLDHPVPRRTIVAALVACVLAAVLGLLARRDSDQPRRWRAKRRGGP